MKRPKTKRSARLAEYYDRRGVLAELEKEPIVLTLDERLRRDVLGGKRAHRLENLSIKLDPAHIQALRKIATMKAIPYQTLIRALLAAGIKRELKLTGS